MKRTIGDYHILKEIGSGGFGAVYLAEKDGKEYALKQLSKSNLDPDIIQRFIREALRIEELRKNHHLDFLVRVYDVLFEHNAFVMDYIPQGSVEYFSSEKDEHFIELLISAINQLHAIGVVHRDIKPENLRVMDNKPIIIDFGIASWWDSRSQIIPTGTKYYSPPEIVCIFNEFKKLQAAKAANRRLIDIQPDNARERIKTIKKLHDVYSLGVTLGELWTGNLPFNRQSYITYLDQGKSEQWQSWLDRIPGRFREFVSRASTFYPDERPQVSELLQDLNIVDSGPPMSVPEMDNGLFFQEDRYRCLACGRDTAPPAHFCSYCGAEYEELKIEISPGQQVLTRDLPPGVSWIAESSSDQMVLLLAASGADFSLRIGRDPERTDLAFTDDNWMSGYHGTIRRKGKDFSYHEGSEGKLPTNPGTYNNIPVGGSEIELLSGAFLQLGSTIFKIYKYFGTVDR